MIILDAALERRGQEGNPVRVAVVGAGTMGGAIVRQLLSPVVGLELAGIANRDPERAEKVVQEASARPHRRATSADEVEAALARGEVAITDDPQTLVQAGGVDVVIEATGDVEHGAAVTMAAIEHGKHVVLVNAELAATLGPLLRVRADEAGVVVSYTDGDEPGILLNLYRYAMAVGYRPVLAGNVKGLLDPYRTPETQRQFAADWGQKPRMVTSFADGTKLSMEMTLVANATGFGVARRGMTGRTCAHVKDVPALFDADLLLERGLVDFVLGAEPGSGGFLVVYDDGPQRRELMRYFKLGDGPFYVFYQPWHLPHLEAPLTAARAVLFHDAAVSPRGGPVCEVLTVAKRDLHAGESLDGIGGFTCYGVIDNSTVAHSGNMLPMALSDCCTLLRDVARDEAIGFDDVDVPPGRYVDELFSEQRKMFDSSGG
jgi:predicted homoserine dehydrogenase-like protein